MHFFATLLPAHSAQSGVGPSVPALPPPLTTIVLWPKLRGAGICSLHPCTPALHCTSLRRYISPPPLHPSEPPPLVTESPPQYARVSRRQQAALAAPGVSSLFYPVASKSQTPSIFLAWGAQPSESPQKSVKLHWRLCSDNMLLHRTPRPSCFCTAYPFVDVLCHILWGYLL